MQTDFEKNLCQCFSCAVFLRMLTHICRTINLLQRCTGIWLHMFSFHQIISHGNSDLDMFSSIYSLKRPQFSIVALHLCELCTFGSMFQQVWVFLSWLLTSIEDERWVKQSVNQTASFSSTSVNIFFTDWHCLHSYRNQRCFCAAYSHILFIVCVNRRKGKKQSNC